jgi:hypothetical protein
MGVTSMMEVMGVSVSVGVASTRAIGESLLARDPMSRPLLLLSISIGSQYAIHAQLASSRRDKVIVSPFRAVAPLLHHRRHARVAS